MKLSPALPLFAALALAPALQAEVKLPAIFSRHMVVQADTAVPVWGWAESGEEVSVSLGDQTKTVRAGTDGKWKVTDNKTILEA